MSKKVSAFLVSHGSIDTRYVNHSKDDKDVDIYHFEIDCKELPDNIRLRMPNILGKPYYENHSNTLGFINRKILEWKTHMRPVVLQGRDRSRSPESRQSNFSDFIAEALTKFEEDEVTAMFNLMDQCDQADSRGYALGYEMPIEQKESRRYMSKATTRKVGIEWNNMLYYITNKFYNLTEKSGEEVLVVIEEINADDGTRTVSPIIETKGEIVGRMNLVGVEQALRNVKRLGLSATDQIYFFDFACNTFNMNLESLPDIKQYLPKLLSCQKNHDGSATIIYGTVSKDQCERQRTAEVLGQSGVKFDESQTSVLSVESHTQPDDSFVNSQVSEAASVPPLLYVNVPIGAIPSIDFGSDVFKSGGNKRKHTKRKRSIKRSYRKRRITRRRR